MDCEWKCTLQGFDQKQLNFDQRHNEGDSIEVDKVPLINALLKLKV